MAAEEIEPTLEVEPTPLSVLLRKHQPMPKRTTPSGEESFKVLGSVLFGPGREIGRNLGTLVHALMEQVGWIDDGFSEADLTDVWAAKGLTEQPAFEDALTHALNAIRSSACRAAFTRPGPFVKLWRERPFDLVLEDGEWISGTVDRVNMSCDAQGRATSATIIDFKTDEIPDADKLAEKIEGYRPQIALYRKAVAKLAGLRQEDVNARLLFTRNGVLAEV
ncbi:MAG: helicase UvrD [Verrucomicrobiaceae bacterium]|nr:helicase UvrD [Verrucomicrobiaceae bacterium]